MLHILLDNYYEIVYCIFLYEKIWNEASKEAA